MDNVKFGLNREVAKLLDDYITKTKTKFAVLLNGEWGCGKTFFIKNYIKNFEEQNEKSVNSEITNITGKSRHFFCYISLFDITSQKEIDTAIIAKANPLLYNEKAKNIGRFGIWAVDKIPMMPSGIGAILKNTSKIVGDFLKKFPKNLVIVLDDVERSKLPIQEILGYVSSLLEENKAKVILLCNEKEIACSIAHSKDKEEHEKLYSKFKEKVIGITQTIIPDPETILSANIDTINNQFLKAALRTNKNNILDIIREFEFKNLRSLEVFIFEAELIVTSFDDAILKDEKSMQNFLQNLFILSYTIKNGEITAQDIKICYTTHFQSTFRKSNNIETPVENSKGTYYKKYSKYIILHNDDMNIFWTTFFSLGIISDKLNIYYTNNLVTTQENISTPLKLWELHSLSSEEFYKYKKIMLDELKNKAYTDPRIILHAFGLLFFISDTIICDYSKTEIVAMASEYIVNNNKLEFPRNYSVDRFYFESGYGKEYYSHDSKEFNTIREILENELQKLIKVKHNDEINSIFQNDLSAFLEKISSNDSLREGFLLHYINPDDFFYKIATAKDRNKIFNACTIRAKNIPHSEIEKGEIISWFKGLRQTFENIKDKLTPFDIFIWNAKFSMDSWVINEINKLQDKTT